MPYTNSSSAHELIHYNPAPSIIPEIEKKRYKVIKKEQEASNLGQLSFKTVLTFFIVVACICFTLSNHVKLNEVNGQISRTQREIKQLESDYVRMSSSLESDLSLRSVELKAEQELGLQRRDQYQTEYISIYEDNQVRLLETTQPDGFSDKVETFVANAVKGIKGIFVS